MPQLDYGTHGYKGLSYSRLETFHLCKRKFEIENALGLASRKDTVTFSYGHSVAAGVQEYLRTGSKQLAVVAAARDYTMPWSDTGTIKEQRAKKSVWYAIKATTRFIQLYESQLPNIMDDLKEYELATVMVDGKEIPAIELQFRVLLENDFVYEGHVDVVMRHKVSKEYAVVEIKTSAFTEVPDCLYANSNQALGYSIILDKLVHEHAQSSYKVFYLVYCSPQQDWEVRSYPKQVKRRFDWINNLIRDCEIIEYYQQAAAEGGIPYPTDGSSCYQFFQPCRYFGSCTMENESLSEFYKNDEAQFAKEDNVHFVFTLEEIINTQVALAESRSGLVIEDEIPVIQEI